MFAAVIFQLDSQSRRVLQENPYEGADNPQELVPHQPFNVGKAESTSILDCIPILHCRYIRALKSYLLCVSSQPSTSAVDTCFAASLSQHLKEALEGWALLPPSPFFRFWLPGIMLCRHRRIAKPCQCRGEPTSIMITRENGWFYFMHIVCVACP